MWSAAVLLVVSVGAADQVANGAHQGRNTVVEMLALLRNAFVLALDTLVLALDTFGMLCN